MNLNNWILPAIAGFGGWLFWKANKYIAYACLGAAGYLAYKNISK